MGVLGFITILLWLVPHALQRAKGEMQSVAKYLQLIYFVIAMIHPDLMVTAIDISLIYLALLAFSLTPSQSKDQKFSNAGRCGLSRL